ncbi:MAG: ArsR family transcriptional regulator [Desulfurococcaceae archaeon]
MKANSFDQNQVQELSRRIRLRILHEDDEVILVTAPNDEELTIIVKELLSYRSMNLKEIHQILSGIASEDKIRKALNTLLERSEVYLDNDGKYVASSV